MKTTIQVLLASAVLTINVGQAVETEADRKAKQAELDARCEEARQMKLAPIRAELVEECVEKKQRSDRAACERYYADYGERAGVQQPLFYDIPECVEAFEYQRSSRQ